MPLEMLLPFQGPLQQMDRPPTLAEMQQLLTESIAAVEVYQRVNPHVANLTKLSNRIKRDMLFVNQLCQQGSTQGVDQLPGGLSESRLQGIVNNLRGFHGELLALHEAPGVIAVCKKFSSQPPKMWAPCCNITQKPSSNSTLEAAAADAAGTGAADAGLAAALAEQQQPQGVSVQPHLAAVQIPAEVGALRWWDSAALGEANSSSSDSLYGSSPGSSSSSSSSADGDGTEEGGTSSRTEQHIRRQKQKGPSAPAAAAVHGKHTYMLADAPVSQTTAAGSSGDVVAAEPVAVQEPLQVEVDVVANEGLTWIEVKNQERFGLESVHWCGGSHAKGLAQQVADLRAVAAAPVNSRRWRCPQVVVYFPSGVSQEVGRALQDMGATVAAGPGCLASLPVPHPPLITNLDVTSLCGLVSQVSWGDPGCCELQAWAARTSHWQECLAAQLASPLLPELHACLDDTQQLVTSCLAVQQFQKLMDMFAGPREQQRWQQLLQRVHVYHLQHEDSSSTTPGCCAACGTCLAAGLDRLATRAAAVAVVAAAHSEAAEHGRSGSVAGQQQQQQQILLYSEPERIARIDKLSKQQRAVFGLGDSLQAITLTANGNAVRCAEQYGVKLEVVLHRPVWLTGL